MVRLDDLTNLYEFVSKKHKNHGNHYPAMDVSHANLINVLFSSLGRRWLKAKQQNMSQVECLQTVAMK